MVPTLVDDGQPIIDSMLINEYLDEKYDRRRACGPTNPLDKARMRVWTKLASDHGLAAVVPRVWPTFKAHTDKLSAAELEAEDRAHSAQGAQRPLDQGRASGLRRADLDAGCEAAKLIVGKMEAGLRDGPWLMGEQYTLADIDLIPFVDRIDEFYKDMLNPPRRTEVYGWLASHARDGRRYRRYGRLTRHRHRRRRRRILSRAFGHTLERRTESQPRIASYFGSSLVW